MKKYCFLVLIILFVGMVCLYADNAPSSETIMDFNAYNTKLTSMDIAQVFASNLLKYLNTYKYYNFYYEIYSDAAKQYGKWRFAVIKETLAGGNVYYRMLLVVQNGVFTIRFTDVSGLSWAQGQPLKEITTFEPGTKERQVICYDISMQFTTFYNESNVTLKLNNIPVSDVTNNAYTYITNSLK